MNSELKKKSQLMTQEYEAKIRAERAEMEQ
jgi:hypothetical protein